MRSGSPDGGCRALVEIEAGRHARALAEALEPDNLQAPPGLRVSCRPQGSLVACVVELECRDPRGILRLRNTLDDLVSAARAALESLRAAGGEA